jgi:hypothetical protein
MPRSVNIVLCLVHSFLNYPELLTQLPEVPEILKRRPVDQIAGSDKDATNTLGL